MRHIIFVAICLFGSIVNPSHATEDTTLVRLRQQLGNSSQDTARMRALYDMCIYYTQLTSLDSALVYGLQAEAISRRCPDAPLVPKLSLQLTFIYSKLSRKEKDEHKRKAYLDNSFAYTQKALADARRLGNEEVSTKSTYNLAHHYAGADSIYLFFKTSLTLLNQLESKNAYNSLDTFIFKNLLSMLCEVWDYDIGSAHYKRYLQDCKRFTPTEGDDYEILCLLELEQAAKFWGKADEQRFLAKYDSLRREFKNPNFTIQLPIELAEYYFQIQEYQKSFGISNTILEDVKPDSLKEYHRLQCIVFKHLLLGKNAYMLGKNAFAIANLKKALADMEKGAMAMITEKHTAYLYLSKAYEKANDYKNANVYIKKAEEVYSQINNHQMQALLAESDVQLEQLKQEKKVQAAQTQVLLKEQEAKAAHRQRNILLFLFAGVLALSLSLVYNYRRIHKLNTTITQQASALEESNVLKDKIFALLSHDLRAPVGRLLLNLDPASEMKRSHIQSELKGIQDILNNVLYWAKMQLKKLEPVYTPVPLRNLIEDLRNEYMYELSEKRLTFINSLDKTTTVYSDENYLKIILRNIISNAIKFTPNEGFIKISSETDAKGTTLSITDTGSGIPDTRLSTIFQLPLPSEGTKKEKGSGLGLSLSLDIAKKLGGYITINSQEQKGTQVDIFVPHRSAA